MRIVFYIMYLKKCLDAFDSTLKFPGRMNIPDDTSLLFLLIILKICYFKVPTPNYLSQLQDAYQAGLISSNGMRLMRDNRALKMNHDQSGVKLSFVIGKSTCFLSPQS